jgi:hypothetical protein
MPNMADISVTNDAGSAQTFTSLVPAGSDRSPARWRNNAGTAPAAFRPTLDMSSRWNGRRDARHLEGKMIVPYFVTDTFGVSQSIANILVTETWVIPQNVPDTLVADTVKFWYDVHLKTGVYAMSLKAGYAPT